MFVSTYIYKKDDKMILIDAGLSKRSLNKELKKLDINPRNISDVFLTHGDIDHRGGLSLFKTATIYCGEGTNIKHPERYKFLADEDTVEVGNIEIKAIKTPGHRSGHTSYLIDNRYLFSGDLIRLKQGKVKPFFKFICDNFEEVKESLGKIANLKNLEMILTPHHGYTTEFHKDLEKWK
jgi:glyoxylase-like metal-dependent hydrolase (beta-lactamase superfamily II)